MRDRVNLDPEQTSTARGSRESLFSQLKILHDTHADFPNPYPEQSIGFGSFQRRTKIRPLDDIDVISCLHANGAQYHWDGAEIHIRVPDAATRLRALCNDGTDELNSRKVVNKFVQRLSTIPQYKRADLKRDGEAAVLALSSYEWSFDVVPAFFTTPEWNGRNYFLIPNGQGTWKKTDPRIDGNRVTRLDGAHDGNLLPIVRLAKYWNKRPTMPTVQSYILELIVLAAHETGHVTANQWVDMNFGALLKHIQAAIHSPVVDPAGIQQGDINSMPVLDRYAVSQRAGRDAQLADEARDAERRKDHKASIAIWRTVFGPEFPAYG